MKVKISNGKINHIIKQYLIDLGFWEFHELLTSTPNKGMLNVLIENVDYEGVYELDISLTIIGSVISKSVVGYYKGVDLDITLLPESCRKQTLQEWFDKWYEDYEQWLFNSSLEADALFITRCTLNEKYR